jgi:hypothetical protein
MSKTATPLSNIELDEISCVDSPACPNASVVLFKRFGYTMVSSPKMRVKQKRRGFK